MDNVTQAKRSEIMAKVRSRDTKPELIVRKLVFSLGYRFRVNVQNLPGKPDIAIRSKKKAIFIHGCFWHRHRNCKRASTPASNKSFWESKFAYNMERDRRHLENYDAMGWKPMIIWECETRDLRRLSRTLKKYLQ